MRGGDHEQPLSVFEQEPRPSNRDDSGSRLVLEFVRVDPERAGTVGRGFGRAACTLARWFSLILCQIMPIDCDSGK